MTLVAASLVLAGGVALYGCDMEDRRDVAGDLPPANVLASPEGDVLSRMPIYFAGLDETVDFVLLKSGQGGSTKLAIRADGRHMRQSAVKRADQEAWTGRHGAMDFALVQSTAHKGPADRVDVAIYFPLEVDRAEFRRAAQSGDLARRQRARGALDERARAAAKPLEAALAAFGARELRSAPPMPVLFANVTLEQLREIARWPQVTRLSQAARGSVPAGQAEFSQLDDDAEDLVGHELQPIALR